MRHFKRDIRRIAREKSNLITEDAGVVLKPEDPSSDMEEVMQELYNRTKLGVKTYNEEIGLKILSVFRLPDSLIQLLLNRIGKKIGYCMTSDLKIVLILEDDTGQILVFGKRRESCGDNEFILSKAIQLIRISFEKLEGKNFVYRDNTGSLLHIDEVIIQIIKWAISS
jgi:hypothetical protein